MICYADWGEGQEKLPNMCVQQILKHLHVEKLQNIFAKKKQDGEISDNTFISVYLIYHADWGDKGEEKITFYAVQLIQQHLAEK